MDAPRPSCLNISFVESFMAPAHRQIWVSSENTIVCKNFFRYNTRLPTGSLFSCLGSSMFAKIKSASIALPLLCLGLFGNSVTAQDKVQFNRDIRPILANTCFTCHGPAARKGGFRLDLRDEAVKQAKSGALRV